MDGGVLRGLRACAGALRDVLVPRGCAGCARPDAVLCDECLEAFRCHRSLFVPGCRSACIHACGQYRGVVREAVLRWKDHGDQECDLPLALCLRALLVRCGMLENAPVGLVPAPSSARSMRSRGRWHTRDMVRELVGSLRCAGVQAKVCAALSLRGAVGKSVMGTASSRAGRLVGHIRLDASRCSGCASLVLVDDIVTTGSTMRQCLDALAGQSVPVVGAVALACAPQSQDALRQKAYAFRSACVQAGAERTVRCAHAG